ncbi:hypothetical protein FALBO_15888 [Fusarium albosuccineum]|uniref:Uncharacterized protein n=1 Tax=Fusarium albosuccineum TaxID=1237068 RepID=A0A8H4PAU0_9HYPO|nr:hypothetical protein FALBO_15888 [Fusarium albosuccineum]
MYTEGYVLLDTILAKYDCILLPGGLSWPSQGTQVHKYNSLAFLAVETLRWLPSKRTTPARSIAEAGLSWAWVLSWAYGYGYERTRLHFASSLRLPSPLLGSLLPPSPLSAADGRLATVFRSLGPGPDSTREARQAGEGHNGQEPNVINRRDRPWGRDTDSGIYILTCDAAEDDSQEEIILSATLQLTNNEWRTPDLHLRRRRRASSVIAGDTNQQRRHDIDARQQGKRPPNKLKLIRGATKTQATTHATGNSSDSGYPISGLSEFRSHLIENLAIPDSSHRAAETAFTNLATFGHDGSFSICFHLTRLITPQLTCHSHHLDLITLEPPPVLGIYG